ncbi:hypothetical protein AB0F52_37320 [Amycolatopsis sp. NPDC024027]|uniref:hypothetical protein n=1 Tax=Amycolatopsis sp. NPDC024027 TaxID=3154327 RepID=UPI0033F327F9
MDGRGYLEKLISDQLGAGRGQPPHGRQLSFDRRELRGVAIGLVAAGALAQEDADRILADLDETLQRSGWLKVVKVEASASTSISGQAVARAVGAERPEWRQAIENPPAPVLRHVVSLAGRTLEAGELTADLVSLEVWSTLLVLNLAHGNFAHGDFDPRRLRERFGADIRWRGWDDAGTQYRGGRAGGSGSHGMFLERHIFEPGPPAEARVLTVAVETPGGRATVEIPLG